MQNIENMSLYFRLAKYSFTFVASFIFNGPTKAFLQSNICDGTFAKVGNGSRFVDVQLGSKFTSVQDIFRNRTQDVNPQS